MRKYIALRPLRIEGRNVAAGEVLWLTERRAALAVAQGLVRLMPEAALLRPALPVEIEVKASGMHECSPRTRTA